MAKASAIANSNIALVKYWGKRDKRLMLPQTGSLSVTLKGLESYTTVEFDPKYREDILIINGGKLKPGTEEYDEYVGLFLNIIRETASTSLKAKIVSNNNYPTAAGLASSASGMAAMALACSKALGLPLDKRNLSILARRGSGSASRSIEGGFVEWHRGVREDGSDSFAEQISPPEYWPEFRMVIAVTSKKEKKIKSRAGMAQSVDNCPYYSRWVEEIPKDIAVIKKAIKERDIKTLGETAEMNALKMHAVMISTRPPIIYWNAGTMDVIHSVMEWRDQRIGCWFTIDGGPQVKVICLEKDAQRIAQMLRKFGNIEEVIVSGPGPGARLVDKHLF